MEPSYTIVDLLRHGEPQGGAKFRGSLDDPLSELGWQQMRKAIQHDDQWDVILSSPLQRCRAFADAIAAERRLPLSVEDGMREVGFGEWEGKTSAEVADSYGDHLKRFWSDPLANTPPGGEALGILHERVTACWNNLLQEHQGKKVLLVCHGGIIRVLLAEVLGIPLERSFSGFAVPFACRSRIRVDRSEHGTFHALLSHRPLPEHE